MGEAFNFKSYLNIPKIYVPYLEDLKSIFQINDTLAEKSDRRIKEAIEKMSKPPSSIIGIHIRANEEYRNHLKAYKAKPVGTAYYQKAMKHFKNVYYCENQQK